MPTNKVQLRSTTEFMSDYQPTYQPIYPLFLNKSQAYAEKVGEVNFKRVETIGDLEAKIITPKDTSIKQISVGENSRKFNKYFFANQYTVSELQDRDEVEQVVAQVLDVHQKQADKNLLFGGGSSNGTQLNNGLYYSSDANYLLRSSVEVDTDADPLLGLHNQIMADAEDADDIGGRKLILFYGTTVGAKVNSLYTNNNAPFKSTLRDALGEQYSLAKIPKAIVPGSDAGYIIVSVDQVKLHYSALPSLKDQGVNDEKMYAWFNFLMGSMMLEPLTSGAIIRRPITFEA